MERKLVKQGQSALTVTLPHEWIKKNGLKEKDLVKIEEDAEKLTLSNPKHVLKRKIKLDLLHSEKGLALHRITGAYIEGYDTISIEHNNSFFSEKMNNALLGMVLEKNDGKELIFKNLISVPEDNFEELFKRSCQLLLALARLLPKIESEPITYEEVKRQERLLDGYLIYCLRYINKYESVKDSNRYFLLVANLENVGDNLSLLAKRFIEEKKGTKKEFETSKLLVESLEQYVVHLFQHNLEGVYIVLMNLRKQLKYETFTDGVAKSICENLYNYCGYLIEEKNKE